METKQAEYRTEKSLLAEKMSKNIGRIEKDAAPRETRLIFAVIAVVVISLTIFGS